MVCGKVGKPYFLHVFTYLMWLWLWWWWTTCIHVQAANDTLKPGDSLNATTELCSENRNYCIGFFSIQSDAYLLLIYGNRKKGNSFQVWNSDGNQPIDNNSGLLSLDHYGVLKIESQDREPIILYSPPSQATNNNNNNTVATLLDTGNFVLQQLHPNGSKSVLWQSFDHPTRSLLPGMKLGDNHKTGHNWSLVSWLGKSSPAPGAFRLEWEPREHELIMRRQGQVIWKSGKLRNNRFEHIPEESQSIYNYTVVSNEDEDYFTYTTLNEDATTLWRLHRTGQLIGYSSHTSDGKDIARADMCYGYNTDGGCQKWDIPNCRHPGQVFEQQLRYLNYSEDTLDESNTSYGLSDCRARCWSNCSCLGFKSWDDDDDGTGCTYFFGKSLEGNSLGNDAEKIYVLVKKADPRGNDFNSGIVKKPNHKDKKKWIWISALVATALLIICPSILCLVVNKRKHVLEDKRRKRMETEMQDEFTGIKDLENDLNKGHDFRVFSYASVMEATSNFSSENKLGQGGFGPVYKGILQTRQEVAVKRLSRTSGQGIVEFKNELKLICELQHKNLVQILGCCIHEQERMLIYEYMPNKSLDFFLFDGTRSKLLNWQKRFNIIEGISQGLLYLHKYSRLKIIHRDLKASNILLDENMSPKISDFGMARIFTQQESTANTNRIVGTYGYMSPEYAMEGVFSTKSDVYSFGVLLLEIVSGRRNNSFYDADNPLSLVGHAWELWNDGECLRLMDPSLNDTFVPEEVKRCIHVGLLCTEHYAKDQPNMSDIVSMLTNKSATLTLPRRPAFYVGRLKFEEGTSSKSIESNLDSTKGFTASTEVESR